LCSSGLGSRWIGKTALDPHRIVYEAGARRSTPAALG
jgi:hypothetical protein